MYERFTKDARRALEGAREAARVRESASIEPIHILVGVATAGGRAAQALATVGVDLAGVGQPTVPEPTRPAGTPIPFSDNGKTVLNEVVRAATTADGLADIEDSHVLLGVLNVEDPVVTDCIDTQTVERLRQELMA